MLPPLLCLRAAQALRKPAQAVWRLAAPFQSLCLSAPGSPAAGASGSSAHRGSFRGTFRDTYCDTVCTTVRATGLGHWSGPGTHGKARVPCRYLPWTLPHHIEPGWSAESTRSALLPGTGNGPPAAALAAVLLAALPAAPYSPDLGSFFRAGLLTGFCRMKLRVRRRSMKDRPLPRKRTQSGMPSISMISLVCTTWPSCPSTVR